MSNLSHPKPRLWADLTLVITTIAILSGCAPNKLLTKEDRATIHSVTVPTTVSVPEKPHYQGPSLALGAAVGGVIGSLIAVSSSSAPDEIKKFMARNDINLDQILLREFERQLRDKGPFPQIVQSPSDAHFDLTIKEYGFVKGWGYTKVKPSLKVMAVLRNPDGTILWSKTGQTNGFTSATPAHPFSTWVSDPKLFSAAFEQSVNLIVAELIADLNEV